MSLLVDLFRFTNSDIHGEIYNIRYNDPRDVGEFETPELMMKITKHK